MASESHEPQRWNQPALLRNQYFKDKFCVRSMGVGRSAVGSWEKSIVEDILRSAEALQAAQAWLDIAFHGNNGDDKVKVIASQDTLKILVETCWLLYQGEQRAALLFINQERKKKDLIHKLNVNSPPSPTIRPYKSHGARIRSVSIKLEASGDHIQAEGDVDIVNYDAGGDDLSEGHSLVFNQISKEKEREKTDLFSSDMSISPDDCPPAVPAASISEARTPENQEGDSNIADGAPAPGPLGRKRRASSGASAGEVGPRGMDTTALPVKYHSPAPSLSSSDDELILKSQANAKPTGSMDIYTIREQSVHVTQSKASAPPKEPASSCTVQMGGSIHLPAVSSKSSGRPSAKKTRLSMSSRGSEMVESVAASFNQSVRPFTRSAAKQQAPNTFTLKVNDSEDMLLGSSRSKRSSNPISLPRHSKEPLQIESIRPADKPSRKQRTRRKTQQNPSTSKTVDAYRMISRPLKRRRTDIDEEAHITTLSPGPLITKLTAGINEKVKELESIRHSPALVLIAEGSCNNEPDDSSHKSVYKSSLPSFKKISDSQPNSETLPHIQLPKPVFSKTDLGKRKFQKISAVASRPAVLHSKYDSPNIRPLAKLPARRSQSKHVIVPSRISIGDHGLSLVEEQMRDAASDALLHMQNLPTLLPDWTEKDDENTRTLDDLDVIDLEMALDNSVITIRDHEPDHRPILQTHPPIWAQSRQEVCESFPWFRSYQGGVYFANDIVKGYLLGGFASSRDMFHHNGKLIVSHGGGKSESIHTREGRLEAHSANDQLAQDKSVRALIGNYVDKRPLVLLADERYKLFPYNLSANGYGYVVLGFYCITHAWAEYQSASNEQGRVVRYKFAFQWCPAQGEPWWTKIPRADFDVTRNVTNDFGGKLDHPHTIAPSKPGRNSSTPVPLTRPMPIKAPVVADTQLRSIESHVIYTKCKRCKMDTPQVYDHGWMCLSPTCVEFWKTSNGKPPGNALQYSSKFLELKPAHDLPIDLPDIRPSPPPQEAPDDITTTYAFTKGWHCRKCGRLSSRYKWEYWECAHCENRVETRSRLRKPKEFWSQMDLAPIHRLGCDSGIIKPYSSLLSLEGSKAEYIKYILPFRRGIIHLIRGNPRVNSTADAIFERYQSDVAEEKVAFRRYPLRAHKCRGTLLTNYFSQNSGEPYQYVGGTGNTVPFSSAPACVTQALDLICARARAVPNISAKFNEILSAAYMERQKMAFHSDSEAGLGPVVASLSLGSAALMHFRPHAHHRSGGKENTLTLTLRHGDILVMDGAQVQECYEHTVVPCNFRIAATARWIGGH